MTPVAPVAASVVWKIEEGDQVRTRVFRSPDLNVEAIVSDNGTAYFPGVGRIVVRGMTPDSLEQQLNQRYATGVLRDPAVQVTMQRNVTLYGQVKAPGVYAVDPATTLLGLVARAGGPSSAGGTPQISLEKSDGRRFLLPGEARLGSIDLHADDAVYMAENSFFVRNATALQATSLVVTMISTLVSVVLIVSR
ncbi:MAG: polysaccharide biosynthesis/export family protein [Gemmatimonadota bacterium]|nr:polysaccharide biosynthesis/export family protein [Gemmatimonadota bacterium]